MNLEVGLKKQASIATIDCGVKMVEMLLDFYEIEQTEELNKELSTIRLFPGIGTYLPQIGEFMLDRGFSVEMITINPFLFTIHHSQLSQENLLVYLENSCKSQK